MSTASGTAFRHSQPRRVRSIGKNRVQRSPRPMAEVRWSIVVHGGARTIAHNRRAANRKGCAAAAQAGAAILRRGGSAVEAVTVAVCILEDDPTFNAGRG